MDRTAWIAVTTCLVLYVLFMRYEGQRAAHLPPRTLAHPTAAAISPTPPAAAGTSSPQLTASASPSGGLDLGIEKDAVLENDFIRVTLTTSGGAIKDIELKQHHNGMFPIVLNQGSPTGILNLSGWEGDASIVPYVLEKSSPSEVAFSRTLSNGVISHRSYQIAGDYQIALTQTLTNPSAQALVLPPSQFNVGTVGPIHQHDQPTYVKADWMTSPDLKLIGHTVLEFDGSNGFLGSGLFSREPRSVITSDSGPVGWIAVKNQFFTLILTSSENDLPTEVQCRQVPLPWLGFKTSTVPHGINAVAVFPGQTLDPGASVTTAFSVYAGPKEYSRIKLLGHHEDLVMEFSYLGWIIKPLLGLLKWIHSYVGNWGLSIILLTVMIKAVLFPFQSAANKSMKQMQAIQPKVKALQEKYKEDMQKLNGEMMKLYREYGVNPMGGCLPLLVQMPIFIGFYTMLQSAVELRSASFLWIHDLSQPDTVAVIPGFGIDLNPLPLIMTATSVLLMRMTPQASDNPQMKVMQFMPVVFLAILYNFASALSLYWTVNNMLSVLQTYYNLKQPVPTLKRVAKKK